MRHLSILMMAVALWLMYRIAYPKPQATKEGGDAPAKRPIDPSEVVVKSRFVRPPDGQPRPTVAAAPETDSRAVKADIFAARNEKNAASEPDPSELDIEPDENETGRAAEVSADEEDEELALTLGREAVRADGLSIEEMDEAMEAARNPTDAKAGILCRVERTDMFEQLVSGDRGKAERISAIIERHIRDLYPESAENAGGESHTDDPMDRAVANFLS